MPHRVIAKSYDIVVVAVIFQFVIKTFRDAPVASFLCMDDDAGLGTLFATCFCAVSYHATKYRPVVSVIVVNLAHWPKHTVGYLVSHLDKFGFRSSLLHCLKSLYCVVIDIATKGVN